MLTRKPPTAPLMTERDGARPAFKTPRFVGLYVYERGSSSRASCLCKIRFVFFLQQQLDERSRGHRARSHADWMSSHSSKGIKETDGAVLFPEENEDETSPLSRYSISQPGTRRFTTQVVVKASPVCVHVPHCLHISVSMHQ